jgi:hypothetical protein
LSLQVSIREATVAQCSAPPSEPANKAFFRFSVIGPDGTLDGVVVELDAAVVEEAGQTLPARQRIADRFGEFALLADQPEFCAQPWLQCVDQRTALLLPHNPTAAAADVVLDRIQRSDALQRFAGDRRRPGVASL